LLFNVLITIFLFNHIEQPYCLYWFIKEIIVRIDEYEHQEKPRTALIAHLKTQLVQLSSQFSEQDELIIKMRNKIEDLKEEKELASMVNARRKRTIKDLTPSFAYRSNEDIEKECADIE
jgi:peptidoglycan hydrolase CwlO-like protein